MSENPYYRASGATIESRVSEIAEVLRLRSQGELDPSTQEIVRASLAVSMGYRLADPSPAEDMLARALESGGLRSGGLTHSNFLQRAELAKRPYTDASVDELLAEATAGSGEPPAAVTAAAIERAAYTPLADGMLQRPTVRAQMWLQSQPAARAEARAIRGTANESTTSATSTRPRSIPGVVEHTYDETPAPKAEPEHPAEAKRPSWQDLVDDAREKRPGLGGNRRW